MLNQEGMFVMGMFKCMEKARLKLSWIWMVMVVALILLSKSKWEDCDLAEECLMAVAMLLTSVSCLGRIWCLAHISGHKNNLLITEGPYSLCRNPLYFFSLLGAIGIGLSTYTFTIPLLIVFGMALVYPAVIKKEEERLLSIHGYSYTDYCSRTSRLIPSWKHYRTASHAVINMAAFTRGMRDTIWLIVAVVLIHLKNEIYDVTVDKALFNLW